MKEKKNKDYARMLPLIIVAVVVLITIAYGYAFSSNDDGMLRAIASGAYTGKPDAHLIYIMYPLGCIFKLFYLILPNVPWYDIFMTGLHLSCWYLLISRTGTIFKERGKQYISIAIETLVLLTLDFKYLVLHQYTVLAALVFSTALFLLATQKEEKITDAIKIILLLTVTLWLRKEVFLMGLPLLALLFLFKLVTKSLPRKSFVLSMLIGTFLISAASLGIESWAYSSKEWKEFKAFNEARTEVYDYFKLPEYDGNEAVYEAQGIGVEEYEVLAHYLDVSLINDLTTENLLELSTRYDEIIKEWQQFYSVPRKIIKDTALAIINNDVQPAGHFMFVICFIVFLLGLKGNSWFSLAALGAYAYRVVFTAYFVSKGRFPERVSYGLFLMISMLMAGLLLELLKEKLCDKALSKKMPSLVFVGFSVLLTITAVLGLVKTALDRRSITVRVGEMEAIYNFCDTNSSNLYFVNTYSIAPLTEKMFSYKALPENCLIMGNWTSHSPLEKERLNVAGVESFEKSLNCATNLSLIEKSTLDSEWIVNFSKARGNDISLASEHVIEPDTKGNIQAEAEEFLVYRVENYIGD